MTLREIALLRLVAQRIVGPRPARPVEAVRWLTAAQAQDLPGALTSVALRVDGGDRAAVVAALDAGELVRSWPMRGTLHLTVAEDLPWLLELLTGRVIAAAASRRARLGIDEPILTRARELAEAALSGGRQLSREQLLAIWQAAGIQTSNQRGYHLLWQLAQIGLLCLGPMRGREQLIVLLPEWIPAPRRLSREEALGELAERFFRSHGPATLKDLVRWANLTVTDARAGLALARPRLERLVAERVEHFLDPATPELLATWRQQAEGVLLLPGFDEYVLGYADRSAAVTPRYADRIVPGGNGVFRPTVVDAGQIVGTWRSVGSGSKRSIDATPFDEFPPRVVDCLPALYAALP